MKNIQLTAFAIIIALTSISFTQAKGTCKKGMHWDYKKAQCVKNSTKSKNKETKTIAEQQLIEAIENNDISSILKSLSKNKKSNLNTVNSALNLVPDNSANVRCMASNPDCGISLTRKILLALQALLQTEGQINESSVRDLLSEFMNSQESPTEEPRRGSILPRDRSKNLIGGNSTTFAPRTFEPSSDFSGDGLVGNYFSSAQVATIHDPSGQNSKSYKFEEVEEKSGYNSDKQAPDGLEFIGSFMSSPKCPAGQMCTMAMKEISLYGKQTTDTNQPTQRKRMKGMYPSSESTQIDDDRFFHVGDSNYRNGQRKNLLGIRAPEDMPEQNKKQSGSSQVIYY